MPTSAADSGFRVPYAALGSVVAILLALLTGWAATGARTSSMDARITALETWKYEHEKKTADLLTELRAIDVNHEKRMAENFATQSAENAELQKTLTELRIVVARQRP